MSAELTTAAPSPLTLPSAYAAARRHIFPSESSFDWFVRRHRDELIKAGVLLRINGRKLIHAEKADAFVLDVGQRAALAEAA